MLINGKRQQRRGEQNQTRSQTLCGSHGLVDPCDPFVHKQGLDHLREQIFLALGGMVSKMSWPSFFLLSYESRCATRGNNCSKTNERACLCNRASLSVLITRLKP